jgi:hypothetical protein
VVAFAGLDGEADRDDVEEGAVHPKGREILVDVELEFIGSRDQRLAFQKGRGAAAIGIGQGGEDEDSVLPEFHAHAGGGKAVGGVEDVGGEVGHWARVTSFGIEKISAATNQLGRAVGRVGPDFTISNPNLLAEQGS